MKNPLSSTFYPVHSGEIVYSSKVSRQTSKFRYQIQKPFMITNQVIFSDKSQEAHNRTIKNCGFSMQKMAFPKFRQYKQMLENARLPSFNIKKLIDQSTKKRKQLKLRQTNSDFSSQRSKKPLINNNELKKYWQKYLNKKISELNFSRPSLDYFSPMKRGQKKSRSQMQKFHVCNNYPFQKRETGERQTSFMNNFIKTTYRKRRVQNKPYLSKELSLKKRRDALQKEKQKDSINWMVPWQKNYDNQEEYFSPL